MKESEPKVIHGIVAMLDVLGVRNATIEESKRLIEFFPAIEEHAELCNIAFIQSHPDIMELCKEGQFTTYRFGDTFLLVWKLKDPREELMALIAIGRVLSHMIIQGLRHGMLLRGAVSIGDMILDERSVLGPVISDVASWYDKTEFIGVVATPQCGQSLSYIEVKPEAAGFTDEQICRSELDASFQKYDVPIKGQSTRTLWVANWTSITSAWRHSCTLGWYFDQTRELTIPIGTEQKYEHTEKFIVEMLKRVEVKKVEDAKVSKP